MDLFTHFNYARPWLSMKMWLCQKLFFPYMQNREDARSLTIELETEGGGGVNSEVDH